MAIRFSVRPAFVTLSIALLGLASCDKFAHGEMNWARAAIERNGQLEVVAIDSNNSVFTVRVKGTGELKTVRADEIIGTLPGLSDPAAKPAAPAPAPSVPAQEAQTAANTPSTSHLLAQPGETAVPPSTEERTTPAQADAAPAEPVGRGVLASGPGYTIKRAGGVTSAPAPAARQVSTTDSRSPVAGLSVEHRIEPIICQGGRLLRIDSRNLEFEGNAVSAEDGCEIHITNSRISAKGVGVFARAANVHIKNSSIEGATGSVEATNGAQVYVQSSTFKGLSRRLDTAALHDLGGNVWN